MNVQILDDSSQGARIDTTRARVLHNIYVKADVDGKFSIDRVPPGQVSVSRAVSRPMGGSMTSVSFVDAQKVDAVAGQTLHLIIGGGGRTLTGHVEIPETLARRQDWLFGEFCQATTKVARPELPMPPELKSAPDKQRAWYAQFVQTEAGKQYMAAQQKAREQTHMYPVMLQQNGDFKIEGVVPGGYAYSIGLKRPNGPSVCGPGDAIATASGEFTVPAGQSDDKPIELPPVELKMLKTVAVGEVAPEFSVKTLGGNDLKLSDYRGKYVLLDFWASWCGPCVAEMPYLKSAVESAAGDRHFAMVGLSLDEKPENAVQFLKKSGSAGVEGFLPEQFGNPVAQDYGVRSIPSIWLIGPDGKVIAKDLRGDAIKSTIAGALHP